MPTTRRRHVITETDALATALDLGQKRWPELSRGRVASRLVEEGARALKDEQADAVQRRREALRNPPRRAHAWYPAGYLRDLRHDWPA